MTPAASWSLVLALAGTAGVAGWIVGRRAGTEGERDRILRHLRDVQRRNPR